MPDAITSVELPGIPLIRSGKVREVFDAGDAYLLVATDRISAFDCIIPNGIPDKGVILNQLSLWWFSRLEAITPHQVITANPDNYPPSLLPFRALLANRSMLVKKTKVIPVECVARGYLIGSGWKEYQATGSVCGIALRPGYTMASKLDEPIFTPASKANTGHDENITISDVEKIVGTDMTQRLKSLTLKLYDIAARHAAKQGIILADTKFEFGINEQGVLLLIDEALTPDSSRYWPADRYAAGTNPPSFDKQYVRDYLDQLDWNKQPPAPALPADVVTKTRENYLEAYRRITGVPLDVA